MRPRMGIGKLLWNICSWPIIQLRDKQNQANSLQSIKFSEENDHSSRQTLMMKFSPLHHYGNSEMKRSKPFDIGCEKDIPVNRIG